MSKNAENDNFDQRLECAAHKRWSKYATAHNCFSGSHQVLLEKQNFSLKFGLFSKKGASVQFLVGWETLPKRHHLPTFLKLNILVLSPFGFKIKFCCLVLFCAVNKKVNNLIEGEN